MKTLEDRLLEKIRFSAKTGCWLWEAAIDRGGYGRLWRGSNQAYAHRIAFELYKGPITFGKQLDHLCRVRHCVNPWHLDPVTAKENVLRSRGLPAINARKIHCKSGHKFSEENTYWYPREEPRSRACKKCRRQADRKWAAKQ